MKLFNRKQLVTTLSSALLVGVGAVQALPDSATHTHVDPIGVGDCQLVTDNWLPPNGMGNAGTFSGWIGHPCPQPRPNHPNAFGSMQSPIFAADGVTIIGTKVVTPEGQHIKQSPFDEPPGSNFLNTVNHNLVDFNGDEMPNTQPSALGSSEYMLHDGPVLRVDINKTSPSEDLDRIIDKLEFAATKAGKVKARDVEMALDILEGNPIQDRAYSGFPMLHYNGPEKLGIVEPIYDENGVKIGGNLDVNMVFWDQRIEADVALIDVEQVLDVPWTITYRVNILTGGIEDFSPMVMNLDRNPNDTAGPLHASMDQSYFPMLDEGSEYTIKIKQTKGKYYNLTYTWGWRMHPPRVQVSENANKKLPNDMTLLQVEQAVFGMTPTATEEEKLFAISKIGDIAPAKRMWNLFNDVRAAATHEDHDGGVPHENFNGQTKNATIDPVVLADLSSQLREAFLDWVDRTKLPAGVTADPTATLTMLYANNTIYGSRQGITGTGITGDDSGQGAAAFKGICNGCAHDWNTRPYNYKVKLYNGDNFVHGYVNVDFGGSRGWENQFQDTDPTTAMDIHPHTEQTVIVGSRFTVVDDVLLDNTSNAGKRALRNVPSDFDGGNGATIIRGSIVETNIFEVVTNDRVFPMNTGGMEEFLEPTPRELNPDGTINDNAAQQFGSGCFFTFGRHHSWPNAGGPWGPILVMPVNPTTGELGTHEVEIEYNYEPSRRLKIYQFDPLHHDVAVYSLH